MKISLFWLKHIYLMVQNGIHSRGHETGHHFLKTIYFLMKKYILTLIIDTKLSFSHSHFLQCSSHHPRQSPSPVVPIKMAGPEQYRAGGAGCLPQPIHRCLWLIGQLIACNGLLLLIKKKKKTPRGSTLIIQVLGGKVVRIPVDNWDRVRASVRARDTHTHTHT